MLRAAWPIVGLLVVPGVLTTILVLRRVARLREYLRLPRLPGQRTP